MANTSPMLLLGIALLGGGVAIAQPTALSDTEVAIQRQALPDWAVEDQQLLCTYQFEGFVDAIAFVNGLVEPAEALGHHPDVTITYNRVAIALTTHDVGGLTTLDFELAHQIAEAAAPRRCGL